MAQISSLKSVMMMFVLAALAMAAASAQSTEMAPAPAPSSDTGAASSLPVSGAVIASSLFVSLLALLKH
ncbi:hypothetical protein CICLE_v10006974mg [Citrus x clementina]|uniref:Uncharacterized protein n=2 Tax=Citrus TaxID=2706 RepID=V4S7A6_CITCL|nr:hypothetical protein CICLE_v10006974mg [Citrus x clementina]GAY61106.1 hypothetical protein CUMW_207190 [Citrus unshiu]